MLQARSPFRTLAKNRTISPPPPSRKGRLFPPCRGNLEPCDLLCVLRGSLLRRPVELSPVDRVNHAWQLHARARREAPIPDRGLIFWFQQRDRVDGAELGRRWPSRPCRRRSATPSYAVAVEGRRRRLGAAAMGRRRVFSLGFPRAPWWTFIHWQVAAERRGGAGDLIFYGSAMAELRGGRRRPPVPPLRRDGQRLRVSIGSAKTL
jgi:hypothetical protein